MANDLIRPDVIAELESFDAAADKIIASFVGPMESQPLPPIIYDPISSYGRPAPHFSCGACGPRAVKGGPFGRNAKALSGL